MLFSAWTWVPVIILIFLIFYANQLPDMKKKAEEKIKEGKVLFEKHKKDVQSKASSIAEKVKEKQKEKEALEKKKQQELNFEDEENISVDDLSFMPDNSEKEIKNVKGKEKKEEKEN